MTTILTHLWQEQGLGKAPFQAVAILSMPSTALAEANPSAYNNALAEVSISASRFGVSLCSCNSCGQALMNNVIIRDADGRHFVVGIDCAGKTNDSKLITAVEALERARQRQIKEEKAEAARLVRIAARNVEEAAQRERNGGLTDVEVAAKEQADAEAERVSRFTTANAWLIDVLDRVPYASDFVRSVRKDLTRCPLADLHGNCTRIIAEIYAKTVSGSRKGSKAYKAAEEAFYAKLDENAL